VTAPGKQEEVEVAIDFGSRFWLVILGGVWVVILGGVWVVILGGAAVHRCDYCTVVIAASAAEGALLARS
jgi:hypothetical protein